MAAWTDHQRNFFLARLAESGNVDAAEMAAIDEGNVGRGTGQSRCGSEGKQAEG